MKVSRPFLMLLEATPANLPVEITESLIVASEEGSAQAVVINPTGCSCSLAEGTQVREAADVTVIAPKLCESAQDQLGTEHNSTELADVWWVETSDVEWRKQKLCNLVGKPNQLSTDQICSLHELLSDCHEAFCLE